MPDRNWMTVDAASSNILEGEKSDLKIITSLDDHQDDSPLFLLIPLEFNTCEVKIYISIQPREYFYHR